MRGELRPLPDEIGNLSGLLVKLPSLIHLWPQRRVGVPDRLGDLIGLALSGFHDLTARIDRVRRALNALRDTLNHRDGILWVHRPGLR
ncbi:Uncharacterised protein [Mycobacteroides abscessus subsp. abscessus]|nr:Uncharacterised protein [Mycobacteroides abscessus subsp. abscessus]SIN23730.1 Uncharacterised protein [Mycobacteroides abscessus subsp. abscessus]SLE03551.1 Uncharacterised protein [Mycobacteroides abscessus subsp. massiliense]